MPAGAPAATDVDAHPERLADLPVRIDCGGAHPFYPLVKNFTESMDPPPAGEVGGAGGHSVGYWRSVAPAQAALRW